MLLVLLENPTSDDLLCHFARACVLIDEALSLLNQPGKDIFMKSPLDLWLHESHLMECHHCTFPQANHMLLGENPGDKLLMSEQSILLAGLLLDATSGNLLLHALLSCFKPLRLNELCVSDFLVLLRLFFNDP